MRLAQMTDGRTVLVSSEKNPMRTVTVDGKPEAFFVDTQDYSLCYINSAWQPVKNANLKAVEFGSPFGVLR